MPSAAAKRITRGRGKPSNSGSSRAREDLAHPVGAEVEAQDAVAVLHPLVVADDRRGG